MTHTAKTPRLMAHIGEPFVEIHPDDAGAIGARASFRWVRQHGPAYAPHAINLSGCF